MDNNKNNLDANWDAILKKLGASAQLPAEAGEFRKARWSEIIAQQQGKSQKPVKRRWFTYSASAVAAVLLIVFTVSLFVFQPALTAQTAIAAFDTTVAARPVYLFEARNFVYDGHSFHMKSYGDDLTGRMFARVEIKSVAPSDKPFYADISIYTDSNGGKLLVQKLEYDGSDILAEIGKTDGVCVPLGLTSTFLCGLTPGNLEMRDLRGMVKSLSAAGEDFTVAAHGDDVVIEGVIMRPELLNVAPLIEATQTAGLAEFAVPMLSKTRLKSNQQINTIVRSANVLLQRNPGAKAVEKTVVDGAVGLAEILVLQHRVAKLKALRPGLEVLTKKLKETSRGAKIKINYDRGDKTIKAITIDNYGPSNGIVNVRFVPADEFDAVTEQIRNHFKASNNS